MLGDRSCYNCEIKFASALEKYINNPEIQFILTNRGGFYNTTNYENGNNVIVENTNDFSMRNIFKSSGVIILDNNLKID